MGTLHSLLCSLTIDTFDLDTELALAQDESEGAIEAGRIASCKELLGVGTTALTTEFLGRTELYIEYTIITYCVAFAAATFDTSRSRVQNLD